MKNFEATESKTRPTESRYREVSGDVWMIFKKYLSEDADLTAWVDDVHALDEKYHETKEYEFMQKLLKVYFDELNRIKG